MKQYNKNLKIKIAIVSIISIFILSVFMFHEVYFSNTNLKTNKENFHLIISITALFLLVMLGVIFIEIYKIYKNKNNLSTKNSLRLKIIKYFSFVASVPAILITCYSIYFFNYGVQNWFNQKVQHTFQNSVDVAKAYISENQKLINTDIRSIAYNLNYLNNSIILQEHDLEDYLSKISEERNFVEAVIFRTDPNFKIIASSKLSLTLLLDKKLEKAINEAQDNVVIVSNDALDKVGAIIKLDDFDDNTYLLISKLIDVSVVNYLKETENSYNEYNAINMNLKKAQQSFVTGFVIFSLILVFCSIWAGLVMTGSIVNPLSALIIATKSIREGNFDIRINDDDNKFNEIGALIASIKNMAKQLKINRASLLNANNEIDQRRRFNETVILNISAGVIVVREDLKIDIINPQALNILNINDESRINKEHLDYFCPEIAQLAVNLKKNGEKIFTSQVELKRINKTSSLIVKIAYEEFGKNNFGFIITFDDISELIIAQRNAAWQDVARRIAHEIKNPLTPIHLASQRLIKKYSHEVEDQEKFNKYTRTILNNAQQIGRMVEEFVNFAKLPTAQLSVHNIYEILDDVVFSEKIVKSNISYIKSYSDDKAFVLCDKGQMLQVFTNLIKNAREMLQFNNINDKFIEIKTEKHGKNLVISIRDNAGGFPSKIINAITEPYVTTKPSGTGLGLAIVKKIIDDHCGKIEFSNVDNGALVRVSLELYKDK